MSYFEEINKLTHFVTVTTQMCVLRCESNTDIIESYAVGFGSWITSRQVEFDCNSGTAERVGTPPADNERRYDGITRHAAFLAARIIHRALSKKYVNRICLSYDKIGFHRNGSLSVWWSCSTHRRTLAALRSL